MGGAKYGMRHAAYTLASEEHENEDTHFVDSLLTQRVPVAGVFDGHGGSACARWLTSEAGRKALLTPVADALAASMPAAPPKPAAVTCGHCGTSAPTLPRCGRCHMVNYCSPRCQQHNWTAHRKVCQTPVASPSAPHPAPAPQSPCDIAGVAAAMAQGFAACESATLGKRMASGACAVVALVHQQHVLVAHLGDCRALLISSDDSALQLTHDHRLSNEAEHARVLERGGWVEDDRVFGLLQPTRSVGDADCKLATPVRVNRKQKRAGIALEPRRHRTPSGIVSSVPEIDCFLLHANATMLVLGSDGLFDKLTNAELASLARSTPPDANPAQRLCAEARARGVRDDITCVILFLNE